MMPNTIVNHAELTSDTRKVLCLEDIRAADYVVFQLRPADPEVSEVSLWRRELSPLPDAIALEAGKKGDVITVGIRGRIVIKSVEAPDKPYYLKGVSDDTAKQAIS